MLDPSPQAGSPRSAPLLSAACISKRYGDFLANDCIDLDLFTSEIHALLGENGAGKSTLVKVMYGLIQPNGGELRWLGRKIVLGGPAEARALGIGMVFQHFTLFRSDAGQGDVRSHPAERRRVALARQEDRAGRPRRGARPRHRHGVPAFHSVPI